jgi:hypothetical protein
MKITRSNDGIRRATIAVKYRIGSREIAMALFLSDGRAATVAGTGRRGSGRVRAGLRDARR